MLRKNMMPVLRFPLFFPLDMQKQASDQAREPCMVSQVPGCLSLSIYIYIYIYVYIYIYIYIYRGKSLLVTPFMALELDRLLVFAYQEEKTLENVIQASCFFLNISNSSCCKSLQNLRKTSFFTSFLMPYWKTYRFF